MFSLGSEQRYWLYSEATDMCKNFYTLSGIVNNQMGADPRNGDVYIFVNRRWNRMKLLYYEKGWVVIYSKILDRGTFVIPAGESGRMVSVPVLWKKLRKIVEGVLVGPDSRHARLERRSISEKRLPENLKDLGPILFNDIMTKAEKELLAKNVKMLNEE